MTTMIMIVGMVLLVPSSIALAVPSSSTSPSASTWKALGSDFHVQFPPIPPPEVAASFWNNNTSCTTTTASSNAVDALSSYSSTSTTVSLSLSRYCCNGLRLLLTEEYKYLYEDDCDDDDYNDDALLRLVNTTAVSTTTTTIFQKMTVLELGLINQSWTLPSILWSLSWLQTREQQEQQAAAPTSMTTMIILAAAINPSGDLVAYLEKISPNRCYQQKSKNRKPTQLMVRVVAIKDNRTVGVVELGSDGDDATNSNDDDDFDSTCCHCGESGSRDGYALNLDDYYLVVQCTCWQDHRGRIQVYQLFQEQQQPQPFADRTTTPSNTFPSTSTTSSSSSFLPTMVKMVELVGDAPGDRLGHVTCLDSTTGRNLRLAVSAPGHDHGKGLVRVYDILQQQQQRGSDAGADLHDDNESGWYYQQIGTDLVEENDGNSMAALDDSGTGTGTGTGGGSFGTALSLSHTGDVTIAIGAPTSHNGRGSVSIFSFVRSPWNGSFWNRSHVIVMSNDHDFALGSTTTNGFGSYVYLTPDASRLVVASSSSSNNISSKLLCHVTTYDKIGSNWVLSAASIDQESLANTPSSSSSLAGFQAVSSTGYTLATLSALEPLTNGTSGDGDSPQTQLGWSRLRVLVDYSPFCSVALVPGDDIDPFLDRNICRSGLDMVTQQEDCESLSVSSSSGIMKSCTWVTDTSSSNTTSQQSFGGEANSPQPSSLVHHSWSPSPVPTFAPTSVEPSSSEIPTITNTLIGCTCDRTATCLKDFFWSKDKELGVCIFRGTNDPLSMMLHRVINFYLQQGSVRYVVLDQQGLRFQSASFHCLDDGSLCQIFIARTESALLTKGEMNLIAGGTVELFIPTTPTANSSTFGGQERVLLGSAWGSVDRAIVPADKVHEGHFSIVIPLDQHELAVEEPNVSVSIAFWVVLAIIMGLILLCCKCALYNINGQGLSSHVGEED